MNDALVCAACGTQIGPAMLVCPACSQLVHSQRLKALAASASTATAENRLTDALSSWREALELLPKESGQYHCVFAEASKLSERIAKTPTAQLRPPSLAQKPGARASLRQTVSGPAG